MADLISMLAAAAGLAQEEGGETDPNFNQTVLLLHGDGTNGAQNNTFVDSSTNNFTITRNGNTTQGTFSPFSAPDGRWSNYFDGTGDYLQCAANSAFQFGTGDFTIEFFWYPTAFVSSQTPIDMGYTNTGSYVIQNSSNGRPYFYTAPSIVFTSATAYTLDDWNHLAVSRSGSTLSMFLNGTRTNTTTNTTNFNANFTLGIGGSPTHSVPLEIDGYLSNVRIVKGSAIYDPTQTTLTVPTAPLTAVSGTSLLTCQSNRFVDNSSNAFAITKNGDVKVTPFSHFAPTAAYDASVNGGSADFSALAGNYLLFPSSTEFRVNTGDFTIECWFYAINDTQNGGLFQISGTSGAFTTSNANQLSIQLYLGEILLGNNTAYSQSVTTYNVNEWTHVALVRSSGTVKVYVNGVSGLSVSDTHNYTGINFVVGSFYVSSLSVAAYLSEFRFVKGTAVYTTNFTPATAPLTAISGTSALLNFTNAGIFDNTGKNVLETVGNAQIDTTTKKFGTGSMEFDGTGDWLLMPPSQDLAFGTGDFTIELWAYPTASPSFACLLDTRNGFGTGGFGLFITSGTGLQIFTSGGTTIFTGTSCITTNTWQHIAVTRSGTDLRVFVDGSQIGSNVTNSADMSDGYLIVGNALAADRNYPLTGYIDDLRITKGVARYTTGFTPPTQAFPNL